MSKAPGIYRTLALLAILSPKPVGNKISKYPPAKENNKANKQTKVGEVGVKINAWLRPDRRYQDVG
jgi:hypothetical protein